QRLGRRIQIQADDVAHLVDEQRVGRELERLLPMRLQAEGTPGTTDRALRQPEFGSQQARAPMPGFTRALVKGGDDQLFNSCIIKLARRTWPRLVKQPIQTTLQEAAAPLADGLPRNPTTPRDCAVIRALRASEDDARTQGQCLRGLMSPRPLDQLI